MRNKIETKDFSIENLNPQIATIYPKLDNVEYNGFSLENPLILDFGKKEKGDLATCNLLFKSEKYKINSTGASCGCTRPTVSQTEDGQLVTVNFDTNKITNNVRKVVSLYVNNNSAIIKIMLYINTQ